MIKSTVSQDDEIIFEKFLSTLKYKENIIYMFFTTNLLHYVLESATLVPDNINLVLIGSALTGQEVDVLEKYFNRPLCVLKNKYRDDSIWDLISIKSKYSFGWLDIDCFILNKNIFCEMLELKDNAAINTVWSRVYKEYYGIDDYFANTFFEFINIKMLEEMKEKYDFTMRPVGLPVSEAEVLLKSDGYLDAEIKLSQEQSDFIKSIYPGIVNRTQNYIDTTHLYQIYLLFNGYNINKIRDLSVIKTYYTNEAIHLGFSNMIHRIKLTDKAWKVYVRFNMRVSYLILNKYLGILPEQYKIFNEEFKNNLLANKIDPNLDNIMGKIQSYLSRQNIETDLFFHNRINKKGLVMENH